VHWPRIRRAKRRIRHVADQRIGLAPERCTNRGWRRASIQRPRISPEELYSRGDAGDGEALLAEARTALGHGRLGVALQQTRAAWTFVGSKQSHPAASLLLADIYEALGRPALAQVARVQAAHRDIPSVDLLEQR